MLDVILLPAFDNMDAFVFCNQHQSVVLSGLIPQGFEGPGVDSLRFGSWARSASRNLPGKSSGCKPTLCSYRVRQVLGYPFFFFFGCPGSSLRHVGPVTPWQVVRWYLISLIRARTCVPCIGRWTFNYWTTREVLHHIFEGLRK